MAVSLAGGATVLAITTNPAAGQGVMAPIEAAQPRVAFSRELSDYFTTVDWTQADRLGNASLQTQGQVGVLAGVIMRDVTGTNQVPDFEHRVVVDGQDGTKRSYVSAGNVASVFDRRTGEPLWNTELQANALSLLVDPAGIVTFTSGERAVSAYVHDPRTGEVRFVVPLGTGRTLAAGADDGHAYILRASEGTGCQMSVLDLRSGQMQELGARWETCGATRLGVWSNPYAGNSPLIDIGEKVGLITGTGVMFDLATGAQIVGYDGSTGVLASQDRAVLTNGDQSITTLVDAHGAVQATDTCHVATDPYPRHAVPWAVGYTLADWDHLCSGATNAALAHLPDGVEAWGVELINGTILVSSQEGQLSAIDAVDTSTRWTVDSGMMIADVAGTDLSTALVLGRSPDADLSFIAAVSLADGTQRWRQEVNGHQLFFTVPTQAIVGEAALLVVTGGHVERWEM